MFLNFKFSTFLMFFALIIFTNCGKDENEAPSNPTNPVNNETGYPSSLEGTIWEHNQSASSGSTSVQINLKLNFTSSNSGTYSFYYNANGTVLDQDYGLTYSYADGSGTYHYTDDNLGALSFDFNVSNDTLHVHDGEGTYFLKQ